MAGISAGQSWHYRAPAGFEASRMVVGAVVRFAGREPIVCVSVLNAPVRTATGDLAAGEIPFLPLAESAFRASVEHLDEDGEGAVSTAFAHHLAAWHDDERGLSAFTVPFEGLLDHLVARQMAAIVGREDVVS
jgi:hypothetical protein